MSWLKKLLFILPFMAACSSNIFSPLAQPNPGEEAAVAMDENRPDDAISALEAALQNDAENWLYVSLLASAKAQKAGLDTTDLALNMVNSGSAGGNGLTSLFSALPPASTGNIALLNDASELLASIPEEALQAGDVFKISIFSTALTALEAKSFDADGSGTFSIDELQNLDEESALIIIENLLKASSAAAIYQASGGTGDVKSSISQIKDQLDAQPGASQAEKLKSLLAARGS